MFKENINSRVSKTTNDKTMLLSKYAICDSKKSRFIKEKEASGLLNSFCYWVKFFLNYSECNYSCYDNFDVK